MNIYISPHFDDAVGSCGCKIYNDYLSGENTLIITVFAKEIKEGFSPFAIELHDLWELKNPVAQRKQENKEACDILHTNFLNLNFTEAIYRKYNGRHLYKLSDSIFGELNEQDKYLEEQIFLKLEDCISANDICYFPSGRGGHVDHILINNIGRKFVKKGYEIVFYADFYYKGGNYENDGYIKVNKCYNTKCIEKKNEAMKKYKSQLGMLFGENTIESYYKIENKKGETYYEKKTDAIS